MEARAIQLASNTAPNRVFALGGDKEGLKWLFEQEANSLASKADPQPLI